MFHFTFSSALYKRTAAILLFVFFLLTTLFLVFYHEPWQDELHAWVIARELRFTEIIYWMRYDGHFAIWHFILRPFAAFGAPLSTLNLISWLLCVWAAGLFIRYAKMPLLIKTLILCSCPFLYYYPVISRPYALLPLSLCFLSALYPVRLRKPYLYALAILFLLYIHSYLAGYAGCLGLLFTIELFKHVRHYTAQRKVLTCFVPLFMLSGALCAFLMVLPAVGESSVVPQTFHDFLSPDHLPRIWQAFCALPELHAPYLCKSFGYPLVCILYYAAILAGLTVIWYSRKKMVFYLVGGFLWTLLMAAFVYPMLMHRAYLPMIMLIFAFTLPADCEKRKRSWKWIPIAKYIALIVLPVLTFADTVFYAVNDSRYSFSNIGQMAGYIESHVSPETKIVTFPADLISSCLTAYLPRHRLYSCRTNERYTCYKRKEQIPGFLNDAVLHYYQDGSREFYLMMHISMISFYRISEDKLKRGFRDFKVEPVYMTQPPAFFPAREDYILLKVTPLQRP